MKELTTEEVKKTECEILDYIDNICRKHNIPYFLDYGTLLGAIRHKGFIPWDDDIDICMKRKDYNRFIKIFNNQKNKQYKLFCQETEHSYYYEHAKVVDLRTRLQETSVIKINDMGVWVDIFPKDNMPNYHKIIKFLINILIVFRIFSVYTEFPKHHSKLFYPLWLLSKLIGYKPFIKPIKYLSTISENKERKLIGDFRDITAKIYTWDKEIFDTCEYVNFENKKYPAPKEWDKYLKGLYGDYMKLPPVEKRIPHRFTVYWK